MNTNWKRNIILFVISQSISLFGSSLVQYAIMWYITLNTQSGVMMTISIICGFLPTFFLSPFAGVWADQYDRKKLIAISDGLIAGVTFIMALFFYSGKESLGLLFMVSGIRALGTAIQTPAVNAFIPQLVPEEHLMRVNGINGSIQSIIFLLSPMISGALLTLATIEVIFLIDIITAITAIGILIWCLKVPPHKKMDKGAKIDYFKDLSKGFTYIQNNKYVKSFFTYDAIYLFLVTPVAFLTPLQVTRRFGQDVWRLTAIEIAFSLGMILGGILMTTWGGFKNRVHSMVFSCFISGFFTLLIGVAPNFVLYLLFTMLIGVVMPIFNTPAIVLLQEKVEPDYLGRIFGVLSMISSSVMPMGMLLFGPIADIIDIGWLLIVTGALLSFQTIFMVKNKTLIEAGKPPSKSCIL
ncbi:DHA3 family macrolide efflux protein-like MFS transporter [Alkalibaculum bacchi]|uniref:DHA3 family macrolide efflux protein-like MFS transporter n=1 Tax=Alkalibaculum bacchi TaxID=645887 RepID=A0A366I1G4_9FIRM|nr:MFS transporter [Alkalibaculum bacchi]RBP59702.1 DHA3 family macrolide efflux protein-like MFS transporter [Alkalibaculum bacchi]